MRVDTDDLVGVSEIAAAFGVKVNVVSNWIARYPSFPLPVLTLKAGKLWRMSDVCEWRDPSPHASFDVV